jgi:hypothetical protein
MRSSPPAWSEALLRIFLRPEVFLSFSGDLLEQYRDSVLPARGLRGADRWYLAQVAGIVLRKSLPWAALFAAAYVARMALDWLWPTNHFETRAQVSTAIAAAILLASGFGTSWKSRSFLAGAAAGLATTATATVLSMAGIALVLAIWHDPRTMTAIAGSGGLSEAFFLPVWLMLPGTVIGGIGGLVGAGARRAV